jgi:hypothetical protein
MLNDEIGRKKSQFKKRKTTELTGLTHQTCDLCHMVGITL